MEMLDKQDGGGMVLGDGLPEIDPLGTAAPIPRLPSSNFQESLQESFMATYHFDTQDAAKYGVECAIVLYNLRFWIKKNAANKKHFHDGAYWTYNSAKAFEELFPFWNYQKIGRLLRKLESDGAIKSGNYNKAGYDKTKWYSLVNNPCSKLINGNIDSDQPIPDVNPDKKQHISPAVAEESGESVEKTNPTPQPPSSPKDNGPAPEQVFIRSIWGELNAEVRKRGGIVSSKQAEYVKFFKEVGDMDLVARVFTYLRSDANMNNEMGWVNAAYNVGNLRNRWNTIIKKVNKQKKTGGYRI